MNGLFIGIEGIGYGGFSAGILRILSRVNNGYYVYKVPCQGVSLSTFKTKEIFSVTNDVPDKGDNILTELAGKVVKVEIPDVFVVSGLIGITFEVFESEDDSEPVFKCYRRPKAKGVSAGEIKILTDVGYNWDIILDPEEAKLWMEAKVPPAG